MPRNSWSAVLLALCISSYSAPSASAQIVTVSSSATGLHHVEPFLAGNAANPDELVIAAMGLKDLDPTNWTVATFWSMDGGESWSPGVFAETQSPGCAADPWLAWGRSRNVYLSCLAAVPTPDGRDFNFRVFLYASSDGGRTWRQPIELVTQPTGEWDHPVLVGAPRAHLAGRDTVFVVGSRPRSRGNGFGIARFVEGQASFDPPLWYDPPERRNDILGSAVALDGQSVAFLYFAMLPQAPRPLYAAMVVRDSVVRRLVEGDIVPWGFPMLTAHRGRDGSIIHGVWLEPASPGALDVVVGRSTDAGIGWTQETITATLPRLFRGRPTIAVDSRGVIAVSWFQATEYSPCGEVVLMSSAAANLDFTMSYRTPTGSMACTNLTDPVLIALLNRWKTGGDYAGLYSPAPGVFALAWADVRDDGFQIRFASIGRR